MSEFSTAQKRAISILRNSGIQVNVVGALTMSPNAPEERTFATKAEREAGNGFACPDCARSDLRVAPVVGRSFHDKNVKGNTEVCDLR